MIDLGISKIALIGAVALIVIGPEKLPRVARTVGTLLGKAQRYVADVKAEVNRSMELEDLKKLQESMEGAVKEVESAVQTTASEFEESWAEATDTAAVSNDTSITAHYLAYRHPGKKWRVKQGAMPGWYKARAGVRTKALSGAARVARYRPQKLN
jgi:sec-independent protein translocase protein TatB